MACWASSHVCSKNGTIGLGLGDCEFSRIPCFASASKTDQSSDRCCTCVSNDSGNLPQSLTGNTNGGYIAVKLWNPGSIVRKKKIPPNRMFRWCLQIYQSSDRCCTCVSDDSRNRPQSLTGNTNGGFGTSIVSAERSVVGSRKIPPIDMLRHSFDQWRQFRPLLWQC